MLWADPRPEEPTLVCRTGHRFSLQSFEEDQRQTVEAAMWAAVRGLREEATLAGHIGRDALRAGRQSVGLRFLARERKALGRVKVLEGLLHEPWSDEEHEEAQEAWGSAGGEWRRPLKRALVKSLGPRYGKDMDRKQEAGLPLRMPGPHARPDSIVAASLGAYGRNLSVDRAECSGAPAPWIPYRSVGPIRVALGDPLLAATAPAWRGAAAPRWVVWYGAPAPASTNTGRRFGQEAIVPTGTFTLHGRRMARLRSTLHSAQRNGILVVEGTWSTLPDDLRRQVCAMQRAWRVRHPIAYGFTLSTFGDATSDDRPWFLGVRNGRVVAFVTWLPSADDRGWVLDLMRQRPDEGHGAVDLLITRGIERACARGLAWVSLGIGIEGSGLHRFKEKFRPDWEDRYILLPGGQVRQALGMGAVAAAHLLPARPRRARRTTAAGARHGVRRRSSPRLGGARFALATVLLLVLLMVSFPHFGAAGRDRADQLADRIQSTSAARRAVSAWEHRPHPSFGHLTFPGPRLRLD